MFYPDNALNIQGLPLLEISVHQIVSQNTGEDEEVCLLFDVFQHTPLA